MDAIANGMETTGMQRASAKPAASAPAGKRGRSAARPGASRRNRSLERGLSILRVFRPGATLRGNGEIAERTGLPRSTVSRLTQTLVACRFLEYDRAANGYRLGAPVLGLAEAFISGSEILQVAVPLMKQVSDRLRVNVSIAVADGEEMVYLHAVRRRDVGLARRVKTGHRTPTEMTSLGRAYLATLSPKEREAMMVDFRKRHRDRWKTLGQEIREAVEHVHEHGYCKVDWLPGVTAIATPVRIAEQTYAISIGMSNRLLDEARLRSELVPGLMGLAGELSKAFAVTDNKKPGKRAAAES